MPHDIETDTAMEPAARLRFDGWTLEREPLELWRDGQRVALQDLPLQLLDALLATPGQLVTREQLSARLWPKRVVDYDTALNSVVRRLRIALRDDADTPRYIETLPRKGYRFIGRLTPEAASAPAVATSTAVARAPRPSQRWPRAALVAAVAAVALFAGGAALKATANRPSAAPVPSIAVLPFEDMSQARDQQYFADGLAEEVLNLLAASPDMRVLARTSSFTFRGSDADVATIARRLDVSHVLEGSVRRDGDRVRVTAQLIDTSNSSHVWSQTFDRNASDLFAVQTDIASAVTAALQIRMASGGPSHTAADARALELLHRARFLYQRRDTGDLERAGELYRDALALNPALARAWAGLASVALVRMRESGLLLDDEAMEQVREAAVRALALDPKAAEAQLRLASYYAYKGDRGARDRLRAQAIESEPDHPLVLVTAADLKWSEGRLDEAIALQRRAVAIEPLASVSRKNLAVRLYCAGRYAEARRESLVLADLSPAELPEIAALSLVLEGDFDGADKLIQAWPDGEARTQVLALLDHGRDNPVAAEAAVEMLSRSKSESAPRRLAEVYAYRREFDAAFEWLRAADARARERNPSGKGLIEEFWLHESPFLAPLRTDARWAQLLAAETPRPAPTRVAAR